MLDSFSSLIAGDVCAGKSGQVLVPAGVVGQLPSGGGDSQYRGHHWTNMNKVHGSIPGGGQFTDGKIDSGPHFPQGSPNSPKRRAQGIAHTSPCVNLHVCLPGGNF